jgi:Flp pilus assembly protein TadB
MELGWKFWLGVIGFALAVGIGGFLAFVLIGWAWYAWGLFGMFLVFGGVAVLIGWIYDRREAKRRKRLAA